MWYAATITTPAAAEPVTTEEAKSQCSVDFADDDTLLDRLIATAREHVQQRCGIRIKTQSVEMKCDGFCDLARLPEGPVRSVTSISYVDADGNSQTLDTGVYETRIDGLEAAIVLKYGQSWPSIQPGSRLTVSASVGYDDVPDPIRHSILMLIASWYEQREVMIFGTSAGEIPAPVAVDAMLANYRRGL